MAENLVMLALLVFWIIPMVFIIVNDSHDRTDSPHPGRIGRIRKMGDEYNKLDIRELDRVWSGHYEKGEWGEKEDEDRY